MTAGALLDGRVAIVTGGARGIGRAIAVGLAMEGARVVVNDLSRAPEVERTVAAIRAGGGRAMALLADVASAAEVNRLVATTVETFRGLDILVNNAALTAVFRSWIEITEVEWDRVLSVNLKGTFLCAQAAYPYLKRSGRGRIINISSVTALVGRRDLLHYASSKAGMIGFTRALARELGPDGITVNAISPGVIRTENEIELFPDQESVLRNALARQAIQRRGLPEDIAGAAVFLASDASAFITGQTISVDGGWAML